MDPLSSRLLHWNELLLDRNRQCTVFPSKARLVACGAQPLCFRLAAVRAPRVAVLSLPPLGEASEKSEAARLLEGYNEPGCPVATSLQVWPGGLVDVR